MAAKEKLKEAKRLYEIANADQRYVLESLFPELKESEDERIRKSLLEYLHTLPNHFSHNGSLVTDWIAWLEKQSEQKPNANCFLNWSEEDKKMLQSLESIVKDYWAKAEQEKNEIKIREASDVSYFLKTIQKSPLCWIKCSDGLPNRDGIYLVVTDGRHNDVYDLARYDSIEGWHKSSEIIYWMPIPQLNNKSIIKQKPAFEMKTPEESLGIDSDTYNKIVDECIYGDDEQKPDDKVEPKFKVKYANSEYNVLEIKEIAGVTYYGIEDEPNHIDYVLPDNCEIINGYAIKENGCPYPTKPAVFSEQKPAETEKGVKRNDREIPFSEKEPYEGLTDFERTLADICIGWIGQELGWKQYIKDNADVLLKIAIKKFNSVQDAIFEKKPAELSHSKVTKISDQAQKPAEWSEEDERMCKAIIDNIQAICKEGYFVGNIDSDELIKWLKFLKDRYTWRPSDEQMMAINTAINVLGKGTINGKYLIELQEQLKKL